MVCCLCMFCVLPVNGLRLYCLYMICYVWCLSYLYFIFIGVMLGMESAADVVISGVKRNADVNVAISFFPRKVDVICMLCWSCRDGLSLCWLYCGLDLFWCVVCGLRPSCGRSQITTKFCDFPLIVWALCGECSLLVCYIVC